MVMSTTEIISEIQIICGDLAEQFTGANAKLKVEYEIQNTLRWLTTNMRFYWNTTEKEFMHTNGEIELPPDVARLIFMMDSDGNENYYLASPEEFVMTKRNSNRTISYSTSTPIPYRIVTSTSSGSDIIELGTFSATPSSRKFYIGYTRVTESVSDVWVPNRLRPFVVSFTAANLLTKLDSPDSNLIALHTSIAKDHLNAELKFGANRGSSNINVNLRDSTNIRLNIGGSDRL